MSLNITKKIKMNYIKDINSFISEAISLKMYKENLPKELWYDKSEGYKKWDSLFGKGVNRISIPLKSSQITIPTSTPLMEEINSIFIPLGYKINSFEDYLNNKVYKINDTKNPMKIGGLLNKVNPTLFKKYDTSTERKEWKDKINNSNKDLKIIISRHPYDLLGMTSGRHWRSGSCMALGTKDDKVYKDILAYVGGDDHIETELGEYHYGWMEKAGANKEYILNDIKEGVLVAYVVNINDNNINKPISRLLIKPYVNKKDSDDILWVSADRVYGNQVDGFKSSVDSWIDTWQDNMVVGAYCIPPDLYSDGKNMFYKLPKRNFDDWTVDDKEDFLNYVVTGTWVLTSQGEIEVDGSVDMSGLGLTQIPIPFHSARNFNCSDNKLTTLKNCPSYAVWDMFNCSYNKLTSLEFSPRYYEKFLCNDNELVSLKGVTKNGGSKIKYFSCSNNKLTSLEFSPDEIEYFYCSNNKLTSLEFSPKIKFKFVCSFNYNLTSLDYFPEIGEDAEVTFWSCALTSLEGCPESVGWNFDIGNNKLTSLRYAPKEVGVFNCSYNYLTSLEFSPEKVNVYNCKEQKNDVVFSISDVQKVCDVRYKIINK